MNDELQNKSDYRIVPRSLLQHCLETFQSVENTSNWSRSFLEDVKFAKEQLTAILAIEKKELKAP